MTDSKALWRSRSFWAGALGFVASLAGLVGVKIDPADVDALSELVPLIIVNVTSVAGIIFRVLAEARIGSTPRGSADRPSPLT